jgi:hypothetical protein
VLYEALPGPLDFSAPIYGTVDDTSPTILDRRERLATPIALDGPLSFLYATAYLGSNELEVETWWRVTDGPISRPFSIMGQLVSPSGETIDRYDKLGVSPLSLYAGDIVVQRHRFSRPPERIEISLRTGVYWLDTMERWTVSDAAASDAFLIPLDLD